jgi:hypothetical protein
LTTFALIAEGITDQIVVRAILSEVFTSPVVGEIDIVPLQPLRDATDESRTQGYGGWELVLEYCSIPERILEALSFNDYIVIHIDTDSAEHANFGVPLTDNGVERGVHQIVEDVKGKLTSKITTSIFDEYAERFIFAIAVHSIECWILPFHARSPAGKRRIHSCERHLIAELHRKNILYRKDHRTYLGLSKDFRKRNKLEDARQSNVSLCIFIDNILNILSQFK